MKTSTSKGSSGKSALAPAMPWREQFAELRRQCQDFHALLDRLLVDSSPGSQGVPASYSSPSDSQSNP